MREVLLGQEPARRLTSTPVRALLAALLVLLVLGDVAAARLERDALLDRARAGEGAVAFADRRVSATVQYAAPQLTSPSAPAEVRADLQALVRREAAGQLSAVERRRDQAARTPVLPWHRTARRARTAYVQHLDARTARLRAVAQDLAALYVRRPALDELLAAARAAFVEAVGEARTREVLGPDAPGP